MTLAPGAAADFVRRHTRLRPVPLVPEVRLHLADDATALWQHVERELGTPGLPPPYWAFAWAGGQALARHLLDGGGAVRNRRVLDFASGSGLVGIAAALAGAARVEAADLDPLARAAQVLNAEANGVALHPGRADALGRDEGWDAVLAGDVFYERDTAAAVTAWLGRLAGRGALALAGDPGRNFFDPRAFEPLASYDVPVTRALEDADTKRAGVWRARASAEGDAG